MLCSEILGTTENLAEGQNYLNKLAFLEKGKSCKKENKGIFDEPGRKKIIAKIKGRLPSFSVDNPGSIQTLPGHKGQHECKRDMKLHGKPACGKTGQRQEFTFQQKTKKQTKKISTKKKMFSRSKHCFFVILHPFF